MRAATSKQQQAISSEIQATLQMLVETDLKIYGEISKGTYDSIQMQGFTLQDGTVQKDKSLRTETVHRGQEVITLSAKEKPSIRTQLRTTAKDMEQCPRPTGRARGGNVR